MLLVGRPQSFLEPNLQPGKPPVLTCLPVLILVLSSGFSMQSRPKKNTSQDSSFPDCTCPLDTAKHFASYLCSRLFQATPRSSRRAERQFMNELRKASCEDASSLHRSFCSPFSLTELSTAISNFSSSTVSGPDQIAYPLLKHLPEPAQFLLLSHFNMSWHSHTLSFRAFEAHVQSLCSKFYPRHKAFRSIATASWGPTKESLSLLYQAFVHPVLTYASPGWFPFICNTTTNHLEVLHRAACRVITGCLFSTPSSLLLLEAQLPPLKLALEHQTLYSFERALRLPPDFSMPWQLETFPVDYRRNPPVDHSVLQPHNHSHPHASL